VLAETAELAWFEAVLPALLVLGARWRPTGMAGGRHPAP
jgi:hypothetical protein